MDDFRRLTQDIHSLRSLDRSQWFWQGDWAFGDVEANDIYYMPRLLDYAHQAFERLLYNATGVRYAYLSGTSRDAREARSKHQPPMPRMTLPAHWFHQVNYRPMYAGEQYFISFDAVPLNPKRIGIRAWVYNQEEELAAVLIWLRWVQLLGTRAGVGEIPDWLLNAFNLLADKPTPV